ncbi:MAG TPA: NAD-dependent epimerase/dehydratase family protein [Thermoanaerobaculia bacterium]|nr:NAD-dependent epimerase/dehydratase family protein [Thermoanaerobaculia bacterium]
MLLTGASGFLGRAVARQLAPGHQLRLLLRPTSSRDGLPPGVELTEGDVTDRDSLARAVAGCEAVVHAAALVKLVAPADAFERVNVGGLENVLAVAPAAGVERVVYVSSFIALGPTEGGPGGTLDETAPAADRSWINPYERTKTLADRLARRAIEQGLPVVVVYPGVIYGPGAMTEGNLVVRGVLEVLHRRLPALVGDRGRRWSYVHVDDVAAGIVAALERAPPGRRYVLGGDNVPLGELYRLVEELSGVPAPRRWLPRAVAKPLGAAMKGWSRLVGGTPRLTPDLVEVCHHDWAYDSSTAERELGYRFRPLRQGMAETLDWLRAEGAWEG